MMPQLFKKIFGTRNERVLKKMRKVVTLINALEPQIKQLSDEDFPKKTAELKQRYQDGATLNDLLPEAFALAREASVRSLGLRPFDAQLIGGMVLHEGKIAEMRTGEGKTLVATLPAYLNSITGKSVHIITVNDYLANRDAAWMGPIYNFLGLTVGAILTNQDQEEKRHAYSQDITYGTNNEFGFDYLRDNMVFSMSDKVQRGLYYAIVDEVDSILIDEARTPLIISGPSEDSSELYTKLNTLVPLLTKREKEDGPGDYALDEKTKQAFLTEEGHQHIEELFAGNGLLQPGESLYDAKNIKLMHYLTAALRAHSLFHRDVEYIVKNNQIVIVDEHTGRTMEGRRWSEGLHQAIEAKEGVPIQCENQTLASITFQNYFRLYEKLAGMTGTADTEAFEFQQIYGLEVIVIPTHKPMIRDDMGDKIYLSEMEKFKAVIADIKQCRAKGQPILVGTSSIETSEKLSSLLNKEKIPHEVLNAKQHEREAKIIAQAGNPGSVTIATNMAGRGTDIVLGGNVDVQIAELENSTPEAVATLKTAWQKNHDKVVEAGGLHVIGSERHESRRIDNQLRGRSGRQGDPGSSRFYLSLQDNLMRIFASDRVALIMKKLGMQENEAIEHPFISRAVENAQRKVEGHNFDIRKHLLEFDDVANEQRRIIYQQRDELMAAEDIHENIVSMRKDVLNHLVDIHIPPQSIEEQWNIAGLEQQILQDFNIQLPIQKWLAEDESLHEETLKEKIVETIIDAYKQKEEQISTDIMLQLEKSIMLQKLDIHWKEHLAAMDHLRHGIHLRGYAQQNPKQEYKRASFQMFTEMLERIKHDVISTLLTINIKTADDIEAVEEDRRKVAAQQEMHFIHSDSAAAEDMPPPENDLAANTQSGNANAVPIIRSAPKIGRNELCPCGSGKKYKNCHGKLV